MSRRTTDLGSRIHGPGVHQVRRGGLWVTSNDSDVGWGDGWHLEAHTFALGREGTKAPKEGA